MSETLTFSSAVDDVIARARRPDRLADAVSFVRATMQECQARKLFNKDWIEDSILATANPHIWTHPDNFRKLQTVRYNMVNGQGNMIFPDEINPGPAQRLRDYYYYTGPTYSVFAGILANVYIDVGYFSFLLPLSYIAADARPAKFNTDTLQWEYLTAVTDDEKATAKTLVTNWMLTLYYDTIVEGALAKLYKLVDDPRQSTHYSLYKSYQSDMMTLEPGLMVARAIR